MGNTDYALKSPVMANTSKCCLPVFIIILLNDIDRVGYIKIKNVLEMRERATVFKEVLYMNKLGTKAARC